jgi:hypothetical protein
MNVTASGLSKTLLQVIPRDFSKFSPVKIRRFFPAIAFAFIASTSFGYAVNLAITPRWSLVSPELRVRPWLKFTTKARLPKWRRLSTQVYIVLQDADAAR